MSVEMTDVQIQNPAPKSSTWPIPLMCVGMCIVAACVLLPQSEANKKLAAERAKLQRDLSYVQMQLSVNEEFLNRVGGDTGLAERLAQRQMQEIRQGSSVLELKGRRERLEVSPFQLLSITPPPTPAPYRPPTGIVGQLCRSARNQLYATGVGMFLIAVGLVMGTSAKTE
jgi:hypothetical protein